MANYADFDIFHNAPVSGVVVPNLFSIAEGVGSNLRIGSYITVQTVDLRYVVTLPSTSLTLQPPSSSTIRFIIFLDRQANSTLPQSKDIISFLPAALNSHLYSAYNLFNEDRFDILGDQYIDLPVSAMTISAAGLYSSPSSQQSGEICLRTDIPIHFSGPAGSVASITSNNIGVLLISYGALGASVPIFSANLRVTFIDH